MMYTKGPKQRGTFTKQSAGDGTKGHHPLLVSGVFEIGEEAPTPPHVYGYKSVHTEIGIRGFLEDNYRYVPLLATAYCQTANEAPRPKYMYSLSGRLLMLNDGEIATLLHTAAAQSQICAGENLTLNVPCMTYATGHGIVIDRKFVEDPDKRLKPALHVWMQHSDYNNLAVDKQNPYIEFVTKYVIRSTKVLERSQGLARKGRELVLTGYFMEIDCDEKQYVINVTNISDSVGTLPAAVVEQYKSGSAITKLAPNGRSKKIASFKNQTDAPEAGPSSAIAAPRPSSIGNFGRAADLDLSNLGSSSTIGHGSLNPTEGTGSLFSETEDGEIDTDSHKGKRRAT